MVSGVVREHRAYLITRVINFQDVVTSSKALIDVCVKRISIVHSFVVKMIICFGWKFHEILLNTVYLRKLCDVDAVDVVCCTTRLMYPIVELRRLSVCHTYQLFLSACDANCFGQKIVLCYNCTVNFYFNLFRNRNLDLTMDLF